MAFGALILDPSTGGVGDALAQLSPTQLPQPGMPQPSAAKPDGVAEEAKDGPDQLPTTPVLPPPKAERKRFQLVEVDGYFRVRTDWFKNFNLGFARDRAPFPTPLSCEDFACEESLSSANMRLRLEPTINVMETARVHTQVDLLDNLVLGSTPDSLAVDGSYTPYGPFGPFSRGQAPPDRDRNLLANGIVVNRAWAEVDTTLGQFTFGRQPWHWGLGIYAHGGAFDPFSGTYDTDADFGTTVDRVMFRTEVPGTNIDAAIATDWASTYPVSSQFLELRGLGGQAFDIEDDDDINQWVVMLARFDRPEIFAEIQARGEWAFNYGGFVAYRTQEATFSVTEEADGQVITREHRGLTTYTPDVWLKLGRGPITAELEAVGTIGEIADVSDIDSTVEGAVSILQFGAVGRVSYRALADKLHVGLEVGYASGDPRASVAQPASDDPPLPIDGSDTTISNFLFNPAYRIDRILFRNLIGTVTNATYLKPNASYAISDELTLRASGIVSFASRPSAAPGDDSVYGVELNGDLSYNHGPFSAGIAYGVLFPMGALAIENMQASTAQTLQTRLIVRF